MFLHSFKNCIKVIFRAKTSLFWTLIFPIALTTFMYVSFGNIMEKDAMLNVIDVAVVSIDAEDNELGALLDELSKDGENKLLNVKKMTDEEAKTALDNEEVIGIIYTDDGSLVVNKSSMDASILEEILKQFKQANAVVTDVITEKKGQVDQELINSLVKTLTEGKSYYTEKKTTDARQDQYVNYFYAIFAMSCLFCSFSSLQTVNSMQANTSSTGMRREVAPVHKLVTIIAEFFALLLIHFSVELITLGYMEIIGVHLGDKIVPFILILLLGCIIGLSLGIIIGAIPKMKINGKIGMAVGISMLLSVLADLCVGGIKRLIELNVPIINRINPAALITDCFYALNVYDDYEIFTRNLIILGAESVLFITVAYLMTRRSRYASL